MMQIRMINRIISSKLYKNTENIVKLLPLPIFNINLTKLSKNVFKNVCHMKAKS